SADVELVAQDAAAPAAVAGDHTTLPGAAAGTWDALGIERARDHGRGPAGGELAEDATDHLGLGRINGAAAAYRLAARIGLAHDVISIDPPTGRPTLAHPAFQAAMGLLGEVLEEERVHGALEADMQLGDLTFGQGHDGDAGECELLEQGGDILL